MAWTTPKTNWVDGDYFNIDPDYNRIKGNIEYLITLSKILYDDYQPPTLETVNISGYPQVSFFNNIVIATRAILENCYSPTGTLPMRTYESNGEAWNAEELNSIENNHLLLYQAFIEQENSIRKLQFTLGGVRIGS